MTRDLSTSPSPMTGDLGTSVAKLQATPSYALHVEQVEGCMAVGEHEYTSQAPFTNAAGATTACEAIGLYAAFLTSIPHQCSELVTAGTQSWKNGEDGEKRAVEGCNDMFVVTIHGVQYRTGPRATGSSTAACRSIFMSTIATAAAAAGFHGFMLPFCVEPCWFWRIRWVTAMDDGADPK
ncbi:hypothetical protein MUK42_34471 [Musa troglodytarum]|uniref:Uncharacterized protein n=1 Tax=Musa troglodytarum TaxID=320322 RepID=A0A9E7FFW9_9LILI|nr:hypothetical protein MUK42_34471 [Musa troglodytarum]